MLLQINHSFKGYDPKCTQVRLAVGLGLNTYEADSEREDKYFSLSLSLSLSLLNTHINIRWKYSDQLKPVECVTDVRLWEASAHCLLCAGDRVSFISHLTFGMWDSCC